MTCLTTKDCLEFMICNVNWKDTNGLLVLNSNTWSVYSFRECSILNFVFPIFYMSLAKYHLYQHLIILMGQITYILNLFSLVHLACIICQTTWGNASSNHMVSRFMNRILTYVNSLESDPKHWSTSIVGQWMDNIDDSLLTFNSFLYHILNKSLKCFLCGYCGYKKFVMIRTFFYISNLWHLRAKYLQAVI